SFLPLFKVAWFFAGAGGASMVCLGTSVLFRHTLLSALFAVALVFLLLFLIYAVRQFHSAKLIFENRIFSVSQASVSSLQGGHEKSIDEVEAMFSPFGVLLNGRVFRFRDGTRKLQDVKFVKETLLVEFCSEETHYHLQLLHGFTQKQEVEKVAEKIRYETGVIPTIHAWDEPK
ncbi:hypothetical protein LJC49_09505, partial [Ruminococcaceae bacterium OttesenSCG-928-I18]|nr:hypothetical protein [Ruminococcaceae bacterium OttesenSCG-928-I18]